MALLQDRGRHDALKKSGSWVQIVFEVVLHFFSQTSCVPPPPMSVLLKYPLLPQNDVRSLARMRGKQVDEDVCVYDQFDVSFE